MKQFLSATASVLVLIFIFSCNYSHKEQSRVVSDVMVVDNTATPTGQPGNDTIAFRQESGERRFVRTASLRCNVNKVDDAVTGIEEKTRALGGFVSFSRMKNTIQDSTGKSTSADSSIQTIHFTTEGLLVLRVPDYQLDSLVAALRPLAIFMLNREISAEDVHIQMLSNQLINQRALKTQHRITADIDVKGKKLSDIEQAEKTAEDREEAADNAKLTNLSLEDKIEYSTISVELYQDPGIRYTTVAQERNITKYEPPFLDQLGESFSSGWQMVKELVISVARYWSILLLCGFGYFIFMKYFLTVKKEMLTTSKNQAS
jgi:Domain of unknown function (DUF4349)